MSSQKQCHRMRSMFGDYWDTKDEVNYLRERIAWLERRPPWWKFRAAKMWKGEEPNA